MGMTKILVLDKNILNRQAVAALLNKKAGLAVTISGNVENAETIVKNEKPKILLLNIEDLNAVNDVIFDRLRQRFPKLPVVVISTRSEAGARAAIHALQNGAIDVITKPEKKNVHLFAGHHLAKRLPPIIRGVNRFIVNNSQTDDHPTGFEKQLQKKSSGHQIKPVKLIVIGGNMGGISALQDIFRKLSPDFPVPVVVVQHFPRFYTKELAIILNKISPLLVREVSDGDELLPGTVWIAPGGRHCEVKQCGNRPYLNVHRGPRENGVRPSIDVLFRSAARLFGPAVLGILLSGTGFDGLAGTRAIQEKGGRILVQNPETALAGELPMSVLKRGWADYACSSEQISRWLIKSVIRSGRTMKKKDSVRFPHFTGDTGYIHPV